MKLSSNILISTAASLVSASNATTVTITSCSENACATKIPYVNTTTLAYTTSNGTLSSNYTSVTTTVATGAATTAGIGPVLGFFAVGAAVILL